jgi:uncharacterized protein YggU (UPF0235/DUF167 family)
MIRVKPRSRQPGVRVRPDGTIEVAGSAPPVDGQANAETIGMLAKHLGVSASRLRLVSGATSRFKRIRLLGS